MLLTLCVIFLSADDFHTHQWPNDQKCLISWVQLWGWCLPHIAVGSLQPCNLVCLFAFYRMSSVDVNDENRGVCPGGKQNSSINDIFALDQPTGRPSILRQTENLPSKAVPKGSKVQNPRYSFIHCIDSITMLNPFLQYSYWPCYPEVADG